MQAIQESKLEVIKANQIKQDQFETKLEEMEQKRSACSMECEHECGLRNCAELTEGS